MDNKNLPAYPTPCAMNENGVYLNDSANINHDISGLSKRELVAAMCLQGLLAKLT